MEKIRVLIAEDDYLVSETVKRAVKILGYELAGKASDGEEAVEMACTLHPDVVLMDIKMPKLDGLGATRQIRDRCPVPVVILTAHDSQTLVEEASKAGASAFLLKPPKERELERAVTIALARHDILMESLRLNKELSLRNKLLEESLSEIEVLRGIIPICANCKNIRDDQGYWRKVEDYFKQHADIQFTHSMCPDCVRKLYPDVADEVLKKD